MDSNPQVVEKTRREDFKAYKSVDYSGFIERLFARGIDFLIVLVAGYLLYRLLNSLTATIVMTLLLDIGVRVTTTYYWGGTFGKLLLGVRVISRNSEKLTIWQIIIRELAKYISWLPLNMGYISIIVSKRRRAWHDIIACTAVTSGGSEEAEYGREIYKERPEKWDVKISAIITSVFIAVLLTSINRSAAHILNNTGMIGFTKVVTTMPSELKYKLPSPSLGLAGVNKNIIQVGDVDGDGGYDVFKEGIKDKMPSIKNIRFTAVKPLDGDLGIVCDKGIIQYRLLDINGDKKDELAVLFEDKMVKVYNLEGDAVEIGSYGPVEYSEITSFIRGRQAIGTSIRLYVLGDKNKVTVLYMRDGKVESEKFELEGPYNFTALDAGVLSGKDCLAGVCGDGKIIFYSNEGGGYKKLKEMQIPVSGKIEIAMRDVNGDGVDEVIVSSPPYEERQYAVLAAYDISGSTMKIMWNGGRHYKYNKDNEISLTLDEGMDIDDDKKFKAYMVSKSAVGQDGSLSLFVFQSDKYLFKLNSFLRKISLSNPR